MMLMMEMHIYTEIDLYAYIFCHIIVEALIAAVAVLMLMSSLEIVLL